MAMAIWAVPAYLVAVSAGHVENLPPAIIVVLCVAFSLAFVYFFSTGILGLIKLSRGIRFGQCADPAVQVKPPTDDITTSPCLDVSYSTDGNKPPPSMFHSIATKQPYFIKSFDDESSLNKKTFGTYTARSNYSDYSQKSRIIGGGNVKPSMVKPTLIRATFHAGAECLADKDFNHILLRNRMSHPCKMIIVTIKTFEKLLTDTNYNFSFLKDTHVLGIRKESSLTHTVKQKKVSQKQVHRNLETKKSMNALKNKL